MRRSITMSWLSMALAATPALAQMQNPAAPASPAAEARNVAQITAVRATQSPKLDGRLDDAVWQNAQWTGDFVQREPQEGKPASERTEVAFFYDDDALYIGARMQSTDPGGVRALVTRRDREESSDQLLVSLDTYRDGRTAYSFAVTAAGVRIDYYHPADFESRREYSFDPVWQAETEINANGWTAEIRIPFTQLRFNESDEQNWGVNIARIIPARNEIAFWRLIGRNETGWASRMGQLAGIQGIRPSRRIELLPYVASDTRVQSEIDTNNPFAEKTTTSARVGGDLKIGLGPSLTLEATINPDFGQVEADPAEVNLTAYETFFAERRPFFLEGTQLLNSRGNFYSRRIGARPLSSVPGAAYVEPISNTTILGAAKLTGRLRSGLSIAALSAYTQEESARTFINDATGFSEAVVAPGTWYGAAVVQQEFGNPSKTSSNAYVLLTGVERSLDDGSFLRSMFVDRAYTGIADYRIRWKGGQYDASAFFAYSWLQGDSSAILNQQLSSRRYYQRPDAWHVEVDPRATTLGGSYLGINHSKMSGKHWLWDIDYYQEAPAFELNDVGRLGSSDGRGFSGNVRYRESTPKGLFRSYDIGLFHGVEWNFGGTPQFRMYELFTNTVLKNFWNASAWFNVSPPVMSHNLTRGGPLMGTALGYSTGLNLSNRAGSRTRYRASLSGSRDDFDSWGATATAGISFRPGTQWEVTIDPRVSRSANRRQYIATRSGGRPETFNNRYIFATVDRSELSARFRVNYAITPDLTLETYAEPFAASGRFFDFGELRAARSDQLLVYGTDGTTITTPDANGRRTVTAHGSSFTLNNQDFNARSFRSNLVLRWEWRPGSTLFLVWQQDRSARLPSGEHVRLGDVWDSLSQTGSNFFAIKLNYWLPIQ
jgi:hypothetical protein